MHRRLRVPPPCGAPPATVFSISMAMVIGPTPPGTGVMSAARSRAAANSTSPTSLPSAMRLVPTSMTTAPGLIQAPRIELRAADRRDQHVGARRPRPRRSRGARVADGHRRVALEQQEGDRLADQVAAADHHGARAVQLDAGRVEQAHDAERRARPQARPAARPGRAWLTGCRPSTSLRGVDRVEHRSASMRRRQRQLHEDAVHVVARVELVHQVEQLACASSRRQLVGERGDAALGAGLALAAHVGRRGRVVADQHRRQPGREP